MLCAPSNAATDELVRRVTDAGSGLKLNVVRLGKKDSAHQSVTQFLLEEQVNTELKALRELCARLDSDIRDTQRNLRQLEGQLGTNAMSDASHDKLAEYAKMMGGKAGMVIGLCGLRPFPL
jgi:hypothetical protein